MPVAKLDLTGRPDGGEPFCGLAQVSDDAFAGLVVERGVRPGDHVSQDWDPAAVEPVPDGLSADGRDRAGAAQGGIRGLGAGSAGWGEADDGLGGADGPDAVAAGQVRE